MNAFVSKFVAAPVAAVVLGISGAMMVASPAAAYPVTNPVSGDLNGSMSFGASGGTRNGTNLLNSTVFGPSSGIQIVGAGMLDFAGIDNGAPFDFLPTSTLDITIANGFGFTMGDTEFGTFVATAGVIVSQIASNVDFFLTGTFTPGTDFGGAATASAGASMRISMNQTGGDNAAASWSATFASPPASLTQVPEPATMALIGAGIMGLGAVGRRRKA